MFSTTESPYRNSAVTRRVIAQNSAVLSAWFFIRLPNFMKEYFLRNRQSLNCSRSPLPLQIQKPQRHHKTPTIRPHFRATVQPYSVLQCNQRARKLATIKWYRHSSSDCFECIILWPLWTGDLTIYRRGKKIHHFAIRTGSQRSKAFRELFRPSHTPRLHGYLKKKIHTVGSPLFIQFNTTEPSPPFLSLIKHHLTQRYEASSPRHRHSVQVVKKVPTFYKTCMFSTVFTNWSWARKIRISLVCVNTERRWRMLHRIYW
jgi:hypothetical protein